MLGDCGVVDMGVGDYVTLSDDPTHYDLSNCPASMALAPGSHVEWSSNDYSQGSTTNAALGQQGTDNGCTAKGVCGLPYGGNYGLGGGWQICFA